MQENEYILYKTKQNTKKTDKIIQTDQARGSIKIWNQRANQYVYFREQMQFLST